MPSSSPAVAAGADAPQQQVQRHIPPKAMVRRLSETTATRLRQAVDQVRAVLSIVGEGDFASDGATTSETSQQHTLDESDSVFCTSNLRQAADTLERILDAADGDPSTELPGTPGVELPSGELQNISSNNPVLSLAVPGAGAQPHASHASMGFVHTSQVVPPSDDDDLDSGDAQPLSIASQPFTSPVATPQSGGAKKNGKKHNGKSEKPTSPNSNTNMMNGIEIPSLQVSGATPMSSFRNDGGADSGRSHNRDHKGSASNPKDHKVVEESTGAADFDVARWLNGTFADQHKRESTGFEMKLQRSNSIMSSMGAARANEKDEEDGAALFASSSHVLPDGSTLVPTTYSRSNSRSYPAFCSEAKYAAALRSAKVERLIGINDSDFDIFPHLQKHGDGVFSVVCANVFLQYNFMNSLGVNMGYFMNFLKELEKHYFSNNPYHNGCHAADVLQTTNVYLCTGDVKENFSDVELIAILFGAMAHDVGHPGTTNAFLQKAQHPLAKLYNDQSTLESMHAAMAFILLDRPECNFFETSKVWTRAHDADFRALAIEVILGTDMKHHAGMTADVCDILEDGQIEDDEVARLFKAIVHAADLSNPMKPQHVYLNWMERVNAEFWQQGDEELRRGMAISIMCDRRNPSVFKSQVGFIEFVVRPFMQELAPVLPPIWIERLQKNLEYVKSGDKNEEEACVKRIQALSAKRWVDVPIRQHSFFTVVMRYFDAYRLSSQLAYDNSRTSPSGSMYGASVRDWKSNGYSPSGSALRLPGGGGSGTNGNVQSTIEVHHCRLAEECEKWMHQIASYRPVGPDGRLRRSASLRSGAGTARGGGDGGHSPNEVPLMLAGPGGTSIQVTMVVDKAPTSDADFFERFCVVWLTTILELQMQLRLQGHQEIDDMRLAHSVGSFNNANGAAGGGSSSTFVPYLDEAAAQILLDSDEGAVLVRRRVEEERRVTASHRTNHEAELEERVVRAASMRKAPAAGLSAESKSRPVRRRESVSFADEAADPLVPSVEPAGTPRAGLLLKHSAENAPTAAKSDGEKHTHRTDALSAVLSDVGATDVTEEEQGADEAIPLPATFDDSVDDDDDASRTFSWLKRRPKGHRGSPSASAANLDNIGERTASASASAMPTPSAVPVVLPAAPTAATTSPPVDAPTGAVTATAAVLEKSESGRMTLYQSIKKSEYVADEDLLLEVIRLNPALAAEVVDRIVRGADAPPSPSKAAEKAAAGGGHRSVSVRVIEPAPEEMSPRQQQTRKNGMIRFVNALTKTLVVAFNNHVRRARDADRFRARAMSGSSANKDDAGGCAGSAGGGGKVSAPGSNVATVDAASILNNTHVRDRTSRWLEDLYHDMDGDLGRRASASTSTARTRSPARSPSSAMLPVEQPGVDRLTIDQSAFSANSSRRPSGRSDAEPLPSHAGTEPHAFFTPDDRNLPAGAAAVLLGMAPVATAALPPSSSGASSTAAQPASAFASLDASPKNHQQQQQRATSPNPGRPPRSPVTVSLAIPPMGHHHPHGTSPPRNFSLGSDVLFIDHQQSGNGNPPLPGQAGASTTTAPHDGGSSASTPLARPKAATPSRPFAHHEASPSAPAVRSSHASAAAAGSPSLMLRKLATSGSHPPTAVPPLGAEVHHQPLALQPRRTSSALQSDSVLKYVNNARRLDRDRLSRAWEGRVLSFTSTSKSVDLASTAEEAECEEGPRRAKSSADVMASMMPKHSGGGGLPSLPSVKPGNRTPDPR